METRRLSRSKTDTMIGGVCGGLGAYFSIDPTLVRLAFVLLAVFGGSGVLIYFIMWIIVPEEGRTTGTPNEIMHDNAQEMASRARELGQSFGASSDGSSTPHTANRNGGLFVGIALIVLGGMFLLQNFVRINFNLLWPGALILIGLLMLSTQFRKPRP
ncbi:MAG TPA: PspC domain-containing protein [Anaerolineae bacterium]